MMRPKSTGKELPPRMLARRKTLASGKVWIGYYYNARDPDTGARREIPLGTDLQEAKRKWAELECASPRPDTGLMRHVFDRYIRDVIPLKAPRTQKENLKELAWLRKVFDTAPVDAITPQHIAQYRDARRGKVSANRELALLSHVFNHAREWGYTARENPCRGVKKNREKPRDFYADAPVWDAVYAAAAPELRDYMDVAYLSGQRPADVLRMRIDHIADGALSVTQNKTGKTLRIRLTDAETGAPNALGAAIASIRGRARRVSSMYLVALPSGQPMTANNLRSRFETARAAAAEASLEDDLAARIRRFQARDIRAKAASEIANLSAASELLGHSQQQITQTVYRRRGALVSPTK